VTDPDANRAIVDPSAAADDTILHRVVAGNPARRGTIGWPPIAQPDSPRAQVVQITVAHDVAIATAAEPDGIDPHMRDLTIFDRNLLCVIRQDHRRDVIRRLAIRMATGRQDVLPVEEPQPAERQAFRRFFRSALDADQLRDARGHDLRARHVLARQRPVEQGAVAVQEPLTRSVQRGAEVLQVIPRPCGEVAERPDIGIDLGDVKPCVLRVKKPPAVARDLPRMIDHRRHIAQARRRHPRQLRERGGIAHDQRVVHRGFLPGDGIKSLGGGTPHVGPVLIRRARAGRTAAIDPELLKIPLARSDFGQRRLPEVLALFLPTGDARAAG